MIVPQAAPVQFAPVTFHATEVFDEPVTVALNCSVAPGVMDTLAGATSTRAFGSIVSLAAADMVGSAALVTTTLTLAGEGAIDGAE